MDRPSPSEYSPYFGNYINLVPAGNIVDIMAAETANARAFLASISEGLSGNRYAAGKWSIRQVIGHLIDTEQIFAYRALRYARHDKAELQGFEQDDYVARGNFDDCTLADLAHRFNCVRDASLALFRSMDAEMWLATGTAESKAMSVRALAYVIVGHQMHHFSVIRDRYLK